MLTSDKIGVLINEDKIKTRVCELGKQISEDFRDKPLLLIAVLKGSAIFLADLIRCIDINMEYDFVSLSSYGSGSDSSGVVRLIKDTDADINNKNILIVEDIVDTGWTLRQSYLYENFLSRGADSVKICALLDKPSRRKADVKVDYCGFVIEDKFVVGYGLDYNGFYRNLPYVGYIDSEE